MDPHYDMSCLRIPPNSHCSIHVLNEFSGGDRVDHQVDSGSDSLSASPSSDYGSERTCSPANFTMPSLGLHSDHHVVHLLVEASETLSIKLGDNYQLIPGPAKVKMVSESGPPGPLPLQVPPGHVVQQIVDESGVLTHVILGSQSNVVQQQQGTPPPHPVPVSGAYCPTPVYDPNTGCSEYQIYSESAVSSPETNDDRWTTYTIKSTPNSYRVKSDKVRVVSQNCSANNSEVDAASKAKKPTLFEVLSNLDPPRLDKIESRSASVVISPPDTDRRYLKLIFEIMLSDHGKDGKYRQVYIGDAFEITLKDLKPATDYFIKTQCKSGPVTGRATSSVGFKTKSSTPDRPHPPKPSIRSKTTIALKWNPTADNGSKITSYTLQCSQSETSDDFKTVFSGLQRQYRVKNLEASKAYWFRLSASNTLGMSEYSELASFWTSGSVPTLPSPPTLEKATPDQLQLVWEKRPTDDSFTLQMEDESTGHGFLTVYNGSTVSFTAADLSGDTNYNFRVNASNDEGLSGWSTVASFQTLPDIPSTVTRLVLKGKVTPTSFRAHWNPVENTEEYIAELKKENSADFSKIYSGNECHITASSLHHSTTYYLRVCAWNNSGQSDWSEILSVETLSTVPGVCGPILVTGRAANRLNLKWDSPADDGGAPIFRYDLVQLQSDNDDFQCDKNFFVVNDLKPATPYQFKVRAINRIGNGPWSEPQDLLTDPDVPGPTQLSAVAKSAHQIHLEWTEAISNGSLIIAHRIEFLDAKENKFTLLHHSCDAKLFHDVKSLHPATTYSFRVQAVNNVGVGTFSPVVCCCTLPASPGQVTVFKCAPKAQSIELKWDPPLNNGSEITSYNVDFGDRDPTVIPALPTEFTLSGLQAEMSYRVRIQAVNEVGVGPFSSSVKVTTGSLPPAPPKLECSVRGSNSLKLRWGEHKKPLRVTLQFRKPKSESFDVVYSGFNQTFKVSKLIEKTEYEFRIFASNEAGDGDTSPVFTFATTIRAPPPPKAPTVSGVKTDRCIINWEPASDPSSTQYRLQISRQRHSDTKEVYHGPKTRFEINDLWPATDYTARVCAVKRDQDGTIVSGAFSELTTFSTLAIRSKKEAANESQAKRESSTTQKEKTPSHMTDTQCAIAILTVFGVFSIVIAFVVHILIANFSDM